MSVCTSQVGRYLCSYELVFLELQCLLVIDKDLSEGKRCSLFRIRSTCCLSHPTAALHIGDASISLSLSASYFESRSNDCSIVIQTCLACVGLSWGEVVVTSILTDSSLASSFFLGSYFLIVLHYSSSTPNSSHCLESYSSLCNSSVGCHCEFHGAIDRYPSE